MAMMKIDRHIGLSLGLILLIACMGVVYPCGEVHLFPAGACSSGMKREFHRSDNCLRTCQPKLHISDFHTGMGLDHGQHCKCCNTGAPHKGNEPSLVSAEVHVRYLTHYEVNFDRDLNKYSIADSCAANTGVLHISAFEPAYCITIQYLATVRILA